MKKYIFIFFPVFLQAMDADHGAPLATSLSSDELVASPPLNIDSPYFRPVTPLYQEPPVVPLSTDSVCEALYYVYFRGNGNKIRPIIMPHLKKQVSQTIDSDSDLEKKMEIYRIAHHAKSLQDREKIIYSDGSPCDDSSFISSKVQDLVGEAVAQAVEEKVRDAQIYERNALTAEQKYELAEKKLTYALISHVLTASCTALITGIIALLINLTT